MPSYDTLPDPASLPPYALVCWNKTDTSLHLFHYGIDNGLTHQRPDDELPAGKVGVLCWRLAEDLQSFEHTMGHLYWKVTSDPMRLVGLRLGGFKGVGDKIDGYTSYQYTTSDGSTQYPPQNWIRPVVAQSEAYAFGFVGDLGGKDGGKEYKITVSPYNLTQTQYAVLATIENWDAGYDPNWFNEH